MKQITVTQVYVIKDSILESQGDPHHLSTDFLRTQGVRIDSNIEIQQLYNVQVPLKHVVDGRIRGDQITALGFLAWDGGGKIQYTKGEAIKKARVFGGKVLKCED